MNVRVEGDIYLIGYVFTVIMFLKMLLQFIKATLEFYSVNQYKALTI